MSFSTYPSYRELDTDGLGMVPIHWDTMPGKRALVTRSGGTAIKGSCADQPAEGLVQGFSASGPDVWLENAEFFGPGLVLSAVGARCGKVFKADGHWGTVANTHSLFPRSNIDRDFAWYLTNNEAWWEKGGSAQPFIKVSETLGRRIALPPLSEQRAIAAFLDRETGKIDALIEKQKRLIALLKEKRQAVISHAVTKGLNPDAKMKDSGVEWLGDVPEHWEVKRLKYLAASIKAGPFGSALTKDQYVSSGYRVYGQEQVIPGDFTIGDYYISPDKFSDLVQYQVLPGDILISCVGTFGKIAVVPEEIEPGIMNPRLIRLRVAMSVLPKYLKAVLRSRLVYEQFSALSRGGTMDVINIETLSSVLLATPSIAEQGLILSNLGSKLKGIDNLAQEAQRAISLLQERRSALISAAVTGKIDVRGLVTPEEVAA